MTFSRWGGAPSSVHRMRHAALIAKRRLASVADQRTVRHLASQPVLRPRLQCCHRLSPRRRRRGSGVLARHLELALARSVFAGDVLRTQKPGGSQRLGRRRNRGESLPPAPGRDARSSLSLGNSHSHRVRLLRVRTCSSRRAARRQRAFPFRAISRVRLRSNITRPGSPRPPLRRPCPCPYEFRPASWLLACPGRSGSRPCRHA